MSWSLALAIFFVAWWICFLITLPWGIRSPHETGEELVPGQASGAPSQPHFARKIIAASLMAAAVTGLAAANARFGWITFDMLPGPGRLY